MTATIPTYRWRLLKRVPGAHKWFIDEITGGLAVCDDSGVTPDRSEDGVLWLDRRKHVKLSQAGGVQITAFVNGEDGTESAIGCNVAELLYLMHEHKIELCIEDGDEYHIVQTPA